MPVLKAELTVNTGGMFSGKSTELLRQGQRHLLAGHEVIYVKPDIDNRYSEDEVVTHDGQKVQAIRVQTDGKALPFPKWVRLYRADVILIDEVQFFSEGFIDDIQDLLEEGKVVYCSGLDMDYTGRPFEVTAHLMAMADKVNKFNAVCSNCGDDAYVTVKRNDSKYRIELGSQDIYKPVCRQCSYKYKEAK